MSYDENRISDQIDGGLAKRQSDEMDKYAAAFAEWATKNYKRIHNSQGEMIWCHINTGWDMTTAELLSLFKESEEYKQLNK